ncbi:glycosyltransferase [Rhodoferax sediminis]|uniref:Glycosyltransferase n=1 Tax=Rhodoferax sediminis TaxID=2509614 RepID=A0A515DFI7_9BURK|nr:glycosyltransferase [Rhodoferax sediminis]QDL39139.1 glycosyltransferase [Rhodoferax sediminis]
MIKVLGMALYGPLAASTRYRLGQYVPGLATHGIDLKICHLLGDDYLRRRFSGSAPSMATMLQAGFNRFADLWGQQKYDQIMLHCELLPLMPGWLERTLIRRPYIYDFDDAFYLKYRSSRFAVTSPFLGSKFDTVMAGAAAVTAGNHVLGQYARQHNANTHYLPTVVDTDRYLPKPAGRNGVFTVGWIGSPSTAPYLFDLVEPLSVLGQEGAVRLIVIGGKAPAIPNVTITELDWQERTEIDLINTFDVGVMPLPDDVWARGKCAFKLIQYMACAVPVIASPVGANIDVVTDECGLLAATHQEWVEALRMMRDQPSKRTGMGRASRERIVQHYSLHRNLPILASVIRKVEES